MHMQFACNSKQVPLEEQLISKAELLKENVTFQFSVSKQIWTYFTTKNIQIRYRKYHLMWTIDEFYKKNKCFVGI